MKKFTFYFSVVFLAVTAFVNTACESDPWQLPGGLRVGQDTLGGTIVQLDAAREHGLVAAKRDQADSVTWEQAIRICESLTWKGYSDWRLPNSEELQVMYSKRDITGGYEFGKFWSTSENLAKDSAWVMNFEVNTGKFYLVPKDSLHGVRPVRSF